LQQPLRLRKIFSDAEGLSEIYDKEIIASTRAKHFGLGFEIYDLGNNEYALSHGGSDKGVQTIVFLLPKARYTILPILILEQYEKLLKHYLQTTKIVDIETK
jgi:hypothetical protein